MRKKAQEAPVEEVVERVSSSSRPKAIMVYTYKRHLKKTLDHTKYPNARMEHLPEAPIYATEADARKAAKQQEKIHEEYIYFVSSIFVMPDKIPQKIMEKIKNRGW